MGSDGIAGRGDRRRPDPRQRADEVGGAGVEFGRILDEVRKAVGRALGAAASTRSWSASRASRWCSAPSTTSSSWSSCSRPNGNLGKARFLMRRHLAGAARAARSASRRATLPPHGATRAVARCSASQRVRRAGWWNMALDEVLLASAARDGVATLRLYRVARPVALARLRAALRCDAPPRCRAAGVTVVRRATGGRAVLHGADLTYAVAAPESMLPPGLEGAYRLLSDALLDALRAIGVAGEPAPRARAARADGRLRLLRGRRHGRDLRGGPQARRVGPATRRGRVLQHGSIRLAPDPAQAARLARVGAGADHLAELGFAAPPAAAHRAGPAAALAARLGRAAATRRRCATTSAAPPGSGPRPLRLDPLAKRSLEASRAS